MFRVALIFASLMLVSSQYVTVQMFQDTTCSGIGAAPICVTLNSCFLISPNPDMQMYGSVTYNEDVTSLAVFTDSSCKVNYPITFNAVSQDCDPHTCCQTTMTVFTQKRVFYAKFSEVDVCPTGEEVFGQNLLKIYADMKSTETNYWSTPFLLFMVIMSLTLGGATVFAYNTVNRKPEYTQYACVPNYQTTL